MALQILSGHFEGTGADLYLQLGAIPKYFKMWGIEEGTADTLEWCDTMAADDVSVEGIFRPKAGGAVEDYAFGEGVSPYYGGVELTSTNQSDTTYGGGVFIERDDKDYRYYTDNAAGISGDASTVTIDTWTLDTAATPSGSFNGDVVGTYINDGSIIRVIDNNEKHTYQAHIVGSALSASGGAADEVTLSWAIPSGKVTFLGGRYGYIPSTIGSISMAGLLINDTSINVDGQMCAFVAWLA